ncbi:hypothetical protein ACFY8Q_31720 [[Kitasatospora] papulosa]|uniref:hypothetical protein n=1 Tax=[Kitasatospora] papulosa TaxID=1464011 RepID=UPI003694917D
MAKRDVWVRVGDELVRGDAVVGISVSDPPYGWESLKILLKVTGHRDVLWIDSGVRVDGEGEGREQVNALADAFVDTLARGAAMPSGALVRLGGPPDGRRSGCCHPWGDGKAGAPPGGASGQTGQRCALTRCTRERILVPRVPR